MNVGASRRLLAALMCMLLTLALVVSVNSCSTAPRRVVLILMDAARFDYYSAYTPMERAVTPNTDKFFDAGLIFARHYANDTATRVSLPQLFYSRYFAKSMFPNSPRVPYSSAEELFRVREPSSISMPEVFRARGFRTAAIVAHPWLIPGTEFAAGFDDLVTPSPEGSRMGPAAPSADRIVAEAIAWAERYKHERYFLYIHIEEPHAPRPLDAYAKLFLAQGSSVAAETELAREIARYKGSLHYADIHLGRLYDWFLQQGLIDDTVFILTADHGEHLGEVQGRSRHGGPWFDAVARTPFMIRAPGVAPRRVATLSEHVDVFPTILELMRLSAPPGIELDGTSVVRPASAQYPTKGLVFAPRAVADGRFKLIFGGDPFSTHTTSTLYDTHADPLETRDVSAAFPEIVTRLHASWRTALASKFERFQAARSGAQPAHEFAMAGVQLIPAPYPTGAAEGADRIILQGPFAKEVAVRLPAHESVRHLSVPIPNGRYALQVTAVGEATFSFGADRADRMFSASETRTAEVGIIVVKDEQLNLRVAPKGTFRLLYLGFRPIVADRGFGTRMEAKEHAERLRTLGYIQ